ncbi:hypothetical protein RI367_004347 [Sorochytrium milnesiophthora]
MAEVVPRQRQAASTLLPVEMWCQIAAFVDADDTATLLALFNTCAVLRDVVRKKLLLSVLRSSPRLAAFLDIYAAPKDSTLSPESDHAETSATTGIRDTVQQQLQLVARLLPRTTRSPHSDHLLAKLPTMIPHYLQNTVFADVQVPAKYTSVYTEWCDYVASDDDDDDDNDIPADEPDNDNDDADHDDTVDQIESEQEEVADDDLGLPQQRQQQQMEAFRKACGRLGKAVTRAWVEHEAAKDKVKRALEEDLHMLGRVCDIRWSTRSREALGIVLDTRKRSKVSDRPQPADDSQPADEHPGYKYYRDRGIKISKRTREHMDKRWEQEKERERRKMERLSLHDGDEEGGGAGSSQRRRHRKQRKQQQQQQQQQQDDGDISPGESTPPLLELDAENEAHNAAESPPKGRPRKSDTAKTGRKSRQVMDDHGTSTAKKRPDPWQFDALSTYYGHEHVPCGQQLDLRREQEFEPHAVVRQRSTKSSKRNKHHVEDQPVDDVLPGTYLTPAELVHSLKAYLLVKPVAQEQDLLVSNETPNRSRRSNSQRNFLGSLAQSVQAEREQLFGSSLAPALPTPRPRSSSSATCLPPALVPERPRNLPLLDALLQRLVSTGGSGGGTDAIAEHPNDESEEEEEDNYGDADDDCVGDYPLPFLSHIVRLFAYNSFSRSSSMPQPALLPPRHKRDIRILRFPPNLPPFARKHIHLLVDKTLPTLPGVAKSAELHSMSFGQGMKRFVVVWKHGDSSVRI